MKPMALVLACAAAVVSTGVAQRPFRSGIDLVHFVVTVVDQDDNLVTGLRQEDFEVYEEGKRQEIRYFAASGDREIAPPLHLGLLFDTSGSMDEDVQFARTAAIRFLNELTRAVDITLVDFDTEVRVSRYGQADLPRLVERIRMREPEGWTALYDAVGVYLDGASDQNGHKILVLYTDGGDTRSSMSFSDCMSLLRMSDITLYAVGFLEHQRASVRLTQQLYLRQMAATTGGEAYFPYSKESLDEIYARILEEIGARYDVGYLSSDTRADGAWREVDIRVTRPDLRGAKVRTRPGYYGPYEPPPGR
jgi:Ca-activated chloride channel family protein